jgi:NAD(P)-dependent dehydrogenase (short-subunit alcohol dehydrogenase family)
MLIEKLKVSKDILSGKVILLTGGGGGIGFEAARALAYLGADVVIAEINEEKGEQAENTINRELDSKRVSFFSLDLAEEKQIDDLYHFIKSKYGFLDVLINNATITPMGAVDVVSIADWDRSYAVNLRAPVMLTRKFLPDMKERNSGIIVFVPSSGAAPYMGAYEVFKTAQVELCNTLSAELEGTGILTYSIGPGLVKTETAQNAIEKVAALMGMDIAEFYELNEKHILDAETAGVGFAVSVVNAGKYNGQEIGSIQALMDAGMFAEKKDGEVSDHSSINTEELLPYIKNVVNVFNEQYNGWLQRSIFERQWVLRDFKKTVGIAGDSFQKLMINVMALAESNHFDNLSEYKSHFADLKKYYAHQYKLLQGFEKNPERLKENSQVILNWISDLQTVIDML